MIRILVLEFGSNKYNKQVVNYLKSTHKCTITTYDLFKNNLVKTMDIDQFDCLLIGGAKKTISLRKLITLEKNAKNNPLQEAYAIIKRFWNKPILAYGYGCMLLGLYYKCDVVPLEEPNVNDHQHIIVDHRYKINKINKTEMGPHEITVTFNNHNTLHIPRDNFLVEPLMFRAKQRFDPCGFRFDAMHYGFIFRLIDSKYGKNIIENFFSIVGTSY